MAQIINKIEELRERLNKMVINEDDTTQIYEISTELDYWIVKYYNDKNLYLD